jgi:penicillin-binding protein 1C
MGLYLHLAPYGGNIEGLRAATLAYFGKEPWRLTPAEAALLVAIPQSPESRRPDRHPDRAADARDRVLARAVAKGIIDSEQAQAARGEVVPVARRAVPAIAPHLADRARVDAPGAQVHRLTIDKGVQVALEVLAAETVQHQGERLQVAMVVADHATGEILASVGSAAFRADARQGFVDMTQALRSPGSTLKPLVYALAFDEGLVHPETMMEDRPTRFGTYAPQNFDRQYRGTVTGAAGACRLSLNIPVVQLTEAMGPARLLVAMDQARRSGIACQRASPGWPSPWAGSGSACRIWCSCTQTLARGGVALPLRWRMDGISSEGARVVSRVAAWQVADILGGLAPPPGAPANRLAYKTGPAMAIAMPGPSGLTGDMWWVSGWGGRTVRQCRGCLARTLPRRCCFRPLRG